MDRIFSVEDISDSFWSSPPEAACPANINRSSSEWFFQKFLEEEAIISKQNGNPDVHNELANSATDKEAVEIKGTQIAATGAAASDRTAEADPTEYAALLKQQLDMYCQAVAIARGSSVKPQDSILVDSRSPASDSSQLGPQAPVMSSGSNGVSSNLQNLGLKSKTATSGSSKELSEDDDLDGEIEINDSMDPAEIKRLRRMLSNRESARRSRRRKQEHLNELESQVKMAEDGVKRVTGSSPTLLPAVSDMSSIIQSHDRRSDAGGINVIVPGGPQDENISNNQLFCMLKMSIIQNINCWYIIVDFCCGANDFSRLMKEKLDSMGKNCSYKNYDIIQPKFDFNYEKRDWMTVRPDELPSGSRLIMGLNPPFGTRAGLANQFIDKALTFKPKLIVLIVPSETQRLDQKRSPYDLIWEDSQYLAGKLGILLRERSI